MHRLGGGWPCVRGYGETTLDNRENSIPDRSVSMATLTGIPFTPITTMRGDVAAPAVITAGAFAYNRVALGLLTETLPLQRSNTMRLPRFSIASILAVIAIFAVALAALRSPSYLWANVTFSLALCALVVADHQRHLRPRSRPCLLARLFAVRRNLLRDLLDARSP